MKRAASLAVVAVFALGIVADSWAGGRGRGSGRSHSGSRPGIAHHHHPHFVGRPLFLGVPLVLPGAYYYYPPPPPYYNPPAPVYIEQYPGTPSPQTRDWFYCPNKGAYYPYVKDCPGGWQRVLPQQPAEPPPVG